MKKVQYVRKKTVKSIIVIVLTLLLLLMLTATMPKVLKWQKKIFSNQQVVNPFATKDKLQVLTNELANQNLPVIFLDYKNENTVEASLSSGVKVVFSLDKDIISSVTSLQLILTRFRIEGRKVKNIDLRFKNAVIE